MRAPEPFTIHPISGRPGQWEVSIRPATGLPPALCAAWTRKSLSIAPPEFLAAVSWPRSKPAARRVALALIEYLRSTSSLPASVGGPSIGDYARLFMSTATSPRAAKLEAKGRPYSPATIENYRDRIERHVLSDKALCSLRMSTATPRELEAFFTRLSRNLGGPCRTLQDVWAILRMVFRQYVIDHPGSPDPFLALSKPSYEVEIRGALTEAELVSIFGDSAIFASPLERAVCALAFWAGLRRGEVFALRWIDIDFAAKRIIVRHAWKRFASKEKSEGGTKGRRQRIVPLSDFVAEALKELRELGEHEFVCSLPDGRLPSAGWWDDHVQAVLDHAGIDRKARSITPHSARHSLASVLESRGVRPRVIGEVLGHQDDRTTEGYLHTAADAIGEITKAINNK